MGSPLNPRQEPGETCLAGCTNYGKIEGIRTNNISRFEVFHSIPAFELFCSLGKCPLFSELEGEEGSSTSM